MDLCLARWHLLTAPERAGTPGTTATFNGTNLPTQANPIVGRIAFWTDDETSKLNLNTAAGFMPGNPPSGYTIDTYAGSFWDTPRFYTAFDMGQPTSTGMPKSPGGGGLAICQLLQNEFQRYPGHPATTSLNPVFGRMWMGRPARWFSGYPLQDWCRATPTSNMNSVPSSSEGGTSRVTVGTTATNPIPRRMSSSCSPSRIGSTPRWMNCSSAPLARIRPRTATCASPMPPFSVSAPGTSPPTFRRPSSTKSASFSPPRVVRRNSIFSASPASRFGPCVTRPRPRASPPRSTG